MIDDRADQFAVLLRRLVGVGRGAAPVQCGLLRRAFAGEIVRPADGVALDDAAARDPDGDRTFGVGVAGDQVKP